MKYFTFPVAGAAYRKLSIAATHTHVVTEAGIPLCKRVKPESILEDYSFDTDAPATCPVCAKRDPRPR